MMTFDSNDQAGATFAEPIAHESFGSLVLNCKRPTLEAQLRDDGFAASAFYCDDPPAVRAAQAEFRLKCVVAGWSDVNDQAGKPLPFTWPTFAAAAEKYPAMAALAVGVANRAFVRGLGKDAEKNSAPPQGGSSTAAA